jgi:hypothetical protein
MADVASELFAGSVGGAVGMLVGHPLDTVKVRMMTAPAGYYASMRDCFGQTVRKEGVAGLFKGLPPPMLSVALYQAVCFASFSSALTAVTDTSEDDSSIGSLFLAGCLSGAATVLVTTPTDLVKIRLQLQMENSAVSTAAAAVGGAGGAGSVSGGGGGGGGLVDMVRCARGVLRSEGLPGFYRGMVATAYRDTWSTGLYFVTYHSTKRQLYAWRWRQQQGRQQQQQGGGGGAGSAAWVELTAGGAAGTVAWGSVVPFDVVKTRLQFQGAQEAVAAAATGGGGGGRGGGDSHHRERRFWPTFRNIVRQEGWARLYSGSVPLLTRAFAVNAVTFYAYEETSRWIGI